MTGYVEGSPPFPNPFNKLPKVGDEDRIRWESRGSLEVQTIVLLTNLEAILEKVNENLDRVVEKLDEVATKLSDAKKVQE